MHWEKRHQGYWGEKRQTLAWSGLTFFFIWYDISLFCYVGDGDVSSGTDVLVNHRSVSAVVRSFTWCWGGCDWRPWTDVQYVCYKSRLNNAWVKYKSTCNRLMYVFLHPRGRKWTERILSTAERCSNGNLMRGSWETMSSDFIPFSYEAEVCFQFILSLISLMSRTKESLLQLGISEFKVRECFD